MEGSDILEAKKRIFSALNEAAANFAGLKRPDRTYSVLDRLGKASGRYSVFPGRFGKVETESSEKGFLFDLCWIEYEYPNYTLPGGPSFRPLQIILAVESEWGPIEDALGDFEKLLTARARLKLFICKPDDADLWLQFFNEYLKYYRDIDESEVFLLALLVDQRFMFFQSDFTGGGRRFEPMPTNT